MRHAAAIGMSSLSEAPFSSFLFAGRPWHFHSLSWHRRLLMISGQSVRSRRGRGRCFR